MGSLEASGHMRGLNMEAVQCLFCALMVGSAIGAPGPQQPTNSLVTQEVLLAPLNIVRTTGSSAVATGQSVIHRIPNAVDNVSNAAVKGTDILPKICFSFQCRS